MQGRTAAAQESAIVYGDGGFTRGRWRGGDASELVLELE